MKIWYYYILFVLITGVLSCQASEEINFNRITDSISVEIEQPKNIIITSEVEWNSFCATIKKTNTFEIDFEKYVVVGVFLGEKPNPGYGVKISTVKKMKDVVFIEYVEYIPKPFDGYIQFVVYPYDIIYFPKIDKEIRFASLKKMR